jgi:Holliday junction resolvasome RuvABC ATP-dependent DNA helicase subunit
MFDILRAYVPQVKITANQEDVANACRGRARDALELSDLIMRYSVMRKTKILSGKGWKELKQIFGIHPKGLKSEEVQLMEVLAEHSPQSVHDLAIRMQVDERNIESLMEVRPKELGFIQNGARGRFLTETGHAYLKKLKRARKV